MKLVFKFLCLLLVILFFVSCRKIENPKFRRLENFGVKKVELSQATVGFNITFHNPNNFGVSVKEAAFDFYADSVFIGHFLQPAQIEVPSNSEFSIPMEGVVPWQQLFNSKLKNAVGKELLVQANGDVKIGKAGVYITKKLAYQGKQKLDLRLLKNPAGAGF